MANNLSNYAEDKLLDHLLGRTAFTMPSTIRVAAFTSDPGETGDTSVEVPTTGGTGYARATLSAPASSGGATSNDAEVVCPPNGSGSNYTVTHVGIVDSVTRGTGNVLISGPLAAPKTIPPGDQFRMLVGELDLALS